MHHTSGDHEYPDIRYSIGDADAKPSLRPPMLHHIANRTCQRLEPIAVMSILYEHIATAIKDQGSSQSGVVRECKWWKDASRVCNHRKTRKLTPHTQALYRLHSPFCFTHCLHTTLRLCGLEY